MCGVQGWNGTMLPCLQESNPTVRELFLPEVWKMTTRQKDPIYGHGIGEFECGIKDCSGHRKKYYATAHRLVHQQNTNEKGEQKKHKRHYTLTEIQEAVRRLTERGEVASVKELARELNAPYGSLVAFVKRLGSQAPRLGIEKHKRTVVKTPPTPPIKQKKKRTLPKGIHFHKGRRGMCNCKNPDRIPCMEHVGSVWTSDCEICNPEE